MKPLPPRLAILQAMAAAFLLAYAAGVPVPGGSPPAAPAAPAAPASPGPSAALMAKVAPVVEALAAASPADRAVWSEIWSKAGRTVRLETPITPEPLFTDARSLRAFTVAALEIGWHRLAGVEPGQYPKLRAAVEEFLKDPVVLGRDDVAVDEAMRGQYAAACDALAWAGQRRP